MKKLLAENYMSTVQKRSRIKSFERLLGLSKVKNYRGVPLDDRTFDGVANCIKTWLNLNDKNFVQTGNTFILTQNDTQIVVDVNLTLGLSPQQLKIKETIQSQGGEYFVVTEFSEFLKQWDNYF